ncbi:thiol-disulfide oxidoreductase [Alkalihalobacillus alcalophilus ATCC 27647 = CGMCC 1.3604]|uniref:Thiol-disulfide oxidoreductase n=1 Tax=Alkalihalobacillus alcalophilus ATCC 27647 = CGMCC 1.3604 TaxID=1218173 RepID=A0A094WR65_ALKAL|nr:thiol-disulfide oxidoreductase ResA [Alkalihalobacillus alcalophilus]KGA98553.1 thiol-disulfide oxidoreductase [Alkalihalobacillus alcalophilus ATCC 27647 = CGMCC 1.3604]MED1560394.1 thiol-disulfide oxidoreductase ResA [Alkalihalobacillus alcalophilus]THG89184.1 thiol-disulfide oxidoreductase [Alkalihalobacillus alcalophilus ATCC 27647 = CGMCC 1.3604]
MKTKRLIMRTSILLVMAVAIGYTFYYNFFADKSVARAGNEAVNFALEDLDGEMIVLDELKGKGVFINFWGTFCPPCVREMPIMEELYQEYQDQGIEIVAVNASEPPLTVERFASRLDLTFPIVIDNGRNVIDAYGIRPLPTTVLVDEEGTIVRVFSGLLTEEIIREFMEEIKPSS